ncbi:threonine synthase [Methylacidiphilum sp. Yel]|jgi:threonine synthase|uniref:threonine synthase n=1 Tax=Methylacidiphilum sp. Yel TaxID=1847730 RepID=UPI0010694D92|nr:threonine synthase [Methylacidiphilum sp. Yel]TFE70404.1 threonine synthase [Methylacidiphilum sp. Yel]
MLKVNNERSWQGIIKQYRDRLPVCANCPDITLLEGNTPLIPSTKLPQLFGKELKVYFKYEGLNPTASFKDRGMVVAITKALEQNKRTVICASTGNTAASAAAYAARADLKCFVFLPRGKIALGKLSQAIMHGAEIVEIDGSFDDTMRMVIKLAALRPEIELVNSVNPSRIEGQKTAAFEICDTLGDAPDIHILPVGNAGNITAYWKGYKEYHESKLSSKLPQMLGFQAEGAAPIVKGKIIENPTTIASAIRIGNPASWKKAVEAARESSGKIDSVTDSEIIEAYQFLATKEGIFVEPASAVSLAGFLKICKETTLAKNTTVVMTLTGHGLKDPAFSESIFASFPRHQIPPSIDKALEILENAKKRN